MMGRKRLAARSGTGSDRSSRRCYGQEAALTPVRGFETKRLAWLILAAWGVVVSFLYFWHFRVLVPSLIDLLRRTGWPF